MTTGQKRTQLIFPKLITQPKKNPTKRLTMSSKCCVVLKLQRKLYRWFVGIVGSSKDKTTRNLFTLFKLALVAILILLAVDLLSIKFDNNASFGTFGDFFGGVLNPILTFLMFMGLLITIVIQQKELKLTRAESRRAADALAKQTELLVNNTYKSDIHPFLSDIRRDLDDLLEEKVQIPWAGPRLSRDEPKTITVNSYDHFEGETKKILQETPPRSISLTDLHHRTHLNLNKLISKLTSFYDALAALAELNTNKVILQKYHSMYAKQVYFLKDINKNLFESYDVVEQHLDKGNKVDLLNQNI
ncbi:MAG: putative membrane protein [Desulforhopalus sp.]